jgi:hypothetical protein
VPNFTSKVEAALHTNFDKANRVIGLTLIPENNRVANRVFNTCGDTELEDASIRSAMDVSRISDFCLRLVCQPSSTSSGRRGVICKYTVLLFPASAPELANTAESQSAGFHGLKIGNGHFPLGLAATKWKCQIVPLIHPSMLFEENDNAPSSTQQRFAIASIMRQAWQLDIARSCKLLKSDKN